MEARKGPDASRSGRRRSTLKTVYIIRHGENLAQITREFSHRIVDHPLTERGAAQARATASRLEGKEICSIFCSPLKRAVETATIIGEALGLEPVVIEEFREVNVGALEAAGPTDENWATYNSVMKDWREGKKESRFPEGEDYRELLERVRRGLSKALGDGGCADVLIVAHGGIFLATMADICDRTEGLDFSTWENCAVTTAEFGEPSGGPPHGRVVSWRDCSHLESS